VIGTWDIDPVHSDMSFTVRHMMVSKVRGRLGAFSSEIVTAPEFTDSTVTASVDASSVDFEVKTYPTWSFPRVGRNWCASRHGLGRECRPAATVARVGYSEHRVPTRWRGLAECLWTSTAPAAPETVDVLPDGCMDLVWSGKELFVAGPDTAPHPYRRPAGLAATGLRFHPGVLPALLRVPADALRDARVPFDALHPALARRTVATLAAGAPAGPVLTALAAALPGDPPDHGLQAAAIRLARGGSAAEAADDLGWTTRTLHRRCLDAFGYGPSVLRRVLRFRRAVALLRAGVAPADAAARAGYADQPHLSREVRALAGVSPGRLRASPPA
jgi:AraC-like DNA-binding protein